MRVRSALGIALLLLTGCKLNTDYFKDYRGVNLLSNYGFEATKPAPASGPQWALEPYADASAKGWTSYLPDDYMTWAEATDLSGIVDIEGKDMSKGKDGTSPAYRLEIKNLFQDGDLEGLAPGSATGMGNLGEAWWNRASAVSKTEISSTSNAFLSTLNTNTYSPIDNQSLFFSGTLAGNLLTLDLDASSVPLWARQGGYRFRFTYRFTGTVNPFSVALSGPPWATSQNDTEGGGKWDATGLAVASSTLVSFSRLFAKDISTATATVTIGSSGSQNEAVIDNVRVIQSDIEPYVTASLPSLNSGSARLLPGVKTGDYTLKFWVHDDPTADQTGLSGSPFVAHASNRMYASGVTVRVKAAVKSGSGTFVQFIARDNSWSKWTEISVPMGFDFVNSDGDITAGFTALQIELSPTNTVDQSTDGRDAGSLLIAQPELTFNP